MSTTQLGGKICYRLDNAVTSYLAKHVMQDDIKYLWRHALLDSGYKKRYVANSAKALWIKRGMDQQVADIKAKMAVQTGITVQSVVQDLIRQRGLSEDKGDLSSAIRCTELIGKTIAAFADKQVNIDDNEVKQLPKDVAEAARERAKIRLLRPKEA